MLGQTAFEPQVLYEGGKYVCSVGLGSFLDIHRRTHACTVAGHSRAVKYRPPDAPDAGRSSLVPLSYPLLGLLGLLLGRA